MKAKIFILFFIAFISITFNGSVKAQNCSVNANVDLSICAHDPLILIGQKAGLFLGAGTTTWTQISGPSAYIVSPNALTTQVLGHSGPNTYIFRLSTKCKDGTLIYDDVTYTVKPASNANAGSSLELAPGIGVASLSGSPLVYPGDFGQWTVIGANNGVTIVNPNSPTSSVNISGNACGVTILQWGITNPNGCGSFDTMTITNCGGVSPVNAGSNQTLSNCYSTTQSANLGATYGGCGIRNQIGTWLVINGPNIPTIADIHSNSSGISNLIAGTYTLRWVVSGPCASGTSDVQIIVPAPTSSVTSASVTSGSQIYCDGRTSTVLTGNLPQYTNEGVLWTQIGGPPGAVIQYPTNRITNVTGMDGSSTYTFRYKITNSVTNCISSADVSISFGVNPTISLAVAQMILPCDVTSASINYTSTGTGGVEWSIVSGPSGCTYAIPTPYVSASGGSPVIVNGLTNAGTYVIRVKKSNGVGSGCEAAYADMVVIVSKTPTASNSGTSQNLVCNVTETDLAGNDPYVGIGTWSQVSGPSTAVVDSVNKFNPHISFLTGGLFKFRWLISGGPACPTKQTDVTIKVTPNIPVVVNAGADQNVCALTPVTLNGNTPLTHETGTWTVVPGAGVTFSDIHAPNAIANGLAVNTNYIFTWTISNACNTSSDICMVQTNGTTGPVPANAGIDQCKTSGTTSVTLSGNNPSPGTGIWTKVSGGSATITDINLKNTTVTGLTDGVYLFEWKISNGAGCADTRDTVIISIGSVPTANAGADLDICGVYVTLNGNNPGMGTGTWEQTVGDGSAIITNPNMYNTTVTNLKSGVYTFKWTIANNICSSSNDEVTINISNPPTPANAGSDFNVCGSTSATLTGNTITTGFGNWSFVSGPNTPTIVDTTNAPTTLVTGLITGTYVFRYTTTGGYYCPVSTDVITVTVVLPANAGADQSFCESTTLTNLIGTISSTGTWSQISGPNTATITTVSTNTAVASGLISGSPYTFRYTVSAPSCVTTDDMTVTLYPLPTVANAGIDQELCNATSILLNGNTPSLGNGTWTKLAGPAGGSFSPNNTTPNATFNGSVPGIYVFVWTISNGSCSNADQVRIVNYAAPTPANAGPDQNIVCSDEVTMNANNPGIGLGNWTWISGPNVPIITSPILPNSTITGVIPGTYTYRWTISNGVCASSYDEVSFTVYQNPTLANAGADQNLCDVFTTNMTANTPVLGTGAWTQISGPNTAVITIASNPTTSISGLTYGTYKFVWTTTLVPCSSSDEVSITVYQTPTTANAGADMDNCLFSGLTLTGNTPSVGTGMWSLISGPSSVMFLTPASPSTVVIGATTGTYVFRWTISNGTCTPSTDDVSVVIHASPTMAIAGSTQDLCDVTATTLAGNTPVIGSGTWTKLSGPAATIDFPNNPATTLSGLTAGVYSFQWQIVNGPCTSEDNVQITIYAKPTVADAGIDQEHCNVSSFTMTGNTALIGTGVWTKVSGPASYSITNPNSPTTTITGVTTGTYVFRWTISNGVCTPSTDDVTIINYIQPNTANAGIDKTVCGTTSTMTANAAVSGTTGTWTYISGPVSYTITNPNSPTTTITGLAQGTYTFRWTISNGVCTPTYDEVVLTVYSIPSTAMAGPDQNICNSTTASLAGNPPVIGTGTWTKLSGPSVTISGINNPSTGLTGLVAGTYTFQWEIVNGSCSSSDNVVVNVYDLPTIAYAGADQQLCNAATFNMAANTATSGTGTWTYISGPGSYSITNPNSPTTTITGVTTGTYVFRWTISNGNCTPTSDYITITNYIQPNTANAGINQNVCGTSTVMAANMQASGTTGTWTLVSGPAIPSISDIHSNTTTVTALVQGTYILRWTISNGTCTPSSSEVTLNVYNIPTVANAGVTQDICIITPSTSTNLAGNTPVIGSGLWSQVSGPNTATIVSNTSPTTSVSNLIVGSYIFKWRITNGSCFSESLVSINIHQGPTPADAGIDQNICLSSPLTLNGNTLAIGTGLWSKVSGPNNPTIVSPTSPITSITGYIPGTYVFRWTTTNGICTSFDEVSITIDALATVANAGTDQNICNSVTGTLDGNTALVGTGTWTKLSGPSVSITNVNNPTSGLTGLLAGTYNFQWQIVNGACSSSDNVIFNVYDLPTVADAGLDQEQCNVTTFTMTANTAVVGNGVWSYVSGPASYSITIPNSPSTTITGVTTGTYVFKWTISNGSCTPTMDEVTIINYIQPNTANAGIDQTICGTGTTMDANLAVTGTVGKWTLVSGPNVPTVSDIFANNASLTNLIQGDYILRWTISNGTCTPSTSDVTLHVYTIPTTANAGSNQSFCSDLTTTALQANTPVIGIGQWSQISGPNTAVIANPSSPTSGLSSLVFGQYTFRWTIANGPCSNYADVTIDLIHCIDLGVTKKLTSPNPMHHHHHIHKLDTVTFTIVLKNYSTSLTATNIVVMDTLPSVFHYVSSTTTNGTYNPLTGLWTLASLNALDSAIMTIRAVVDTSGQNNVYIISQTYPDTYLPNNKSFASVTAKHSSSGHDGGVESNGNLASKLGLMKFIKHKDRSINYDDPTQLELFSPASVVTAKTKNTLSSDLTSFIPMTGPSGTTGFVTTPSNLIGITNAIEILSVDYFNLDNDRQASILGITTNTSTVYDHTKMVCDRLDGARLESVNYITIKGKPFYIARLVQDNGSVDYTINFIAFKNGINYSIDNQWDLESYQPSGNNPVLNFQVWSVNEVYTIKLVEDIFDKMTSLGFNLNILNVTPPAIPLVYVVNGTYRDGNIEMTLANTSGASSVNLIGTKANVEDGVRYPFNYATPISTAYSNNITAPTGNVFDIGFSLSNNSNTTKDVLYFADGPWGREFDQAGASISDFSISTQFNPPMSGAFNLGRNANLEGSVKTYASLYRALRVGNKPINLTNYNKLEFTAFGSGSFDVIISKASIVNWNEQYKTTVNLDNNNPITFKIPFTQFTNAQGQQNFTAEDAVTVVFVKKGNNSTYQNFTLNVKDMRFINNTSGIDAQNAKVSSFTVSPNPFHSITNITFNLPSDQKVKIELYSLDGKLIKSVENKMYYRGLNSETINAEELKAGVYMIKLETETNSLYEKVVLVK